MKKNSHKKPVPFSPFKDFRDAAQEILKVLHQRAGFRLWMIVKPDNNDSGVVLVAEGHEYNIKPGDMVSWSDSICYRMIHGQGPNIAPSIDKIPEYSGAPVNKQLSIKACISIPLINADGSVYGTLCAIDPEPQPESINQHKEFIFLQARLLSSLITVENQKKSISRELKREQQKSQIDELTGIYNRRGWDNHIAIEEERCQRYNSRASVVIIDLDDLKNINDSKGHAEGDVLIHEAAECLRSVVRPFDIVARVGGDEFALLIVGASDKLTKQLIKRIRGKLDKAKISASIGWAARGDRMIRDVVRLVEESRHNNSLNDVMQLADERMYEDKEKRKKKKRKRKKAGSG